MMPFLFVRRVIPFLLLLALLSACSPTVATVTSSVSIERTKNITVDPAGPQPVALINGRLIDGTGGEPISDAGLLLQGERILAVGPQASLDLPANVKMIDLQGATILPGFINAHVHQAFNASRLAAWARAGVTTVRDEGTYGALAEQIRQRDTVLTRPEYATIISAGEMISVPQGYGDLFVNSVEEARQAVTDEIKDGADLLKISLEDGYAGMHGLPKLSSEQIEAIVQTAHAQGKKVSAHITQSYYLEQMVAAGVDDIAHTPYDYLSDEAIAEMVRKNIYMNTTFTVLKYYNGTGVSVDNLRRFVQAGGQVAMGNDYITASDVFELGMPMYEFEKMSEAGMTPMQIIVASTHSAAHVCDQEENLGTLEPGKLADILVVRGDPLLDLKTLKDVVLVIHQGITIYPQNE